MYGRINNVPNQRPDDDDDDDDGHGSRCLKREDFGDCTITFFSHDLI